MSVAQLPASTVKLITSTQIITSVSSAIKELVENSLDAGATSVDVKLINNGLDRIEVKDNGTGISKENTACVALPHYTSKISSFSDLESLETYGFRGEALNALCQVGQVTLITATASDPMTVVYTLDSCGNVTSSKPSHHVQGTTVVVSNLFKNLPVRRQLMGSGRRAQEELKQVETVVKSLAVIKPSIRVTLSHNKCQIWQKTPCSSLQSSFSQLVGYSTCQQLEQLSFSVSDEIFGDLIVPKKDCDISAVTKSTPAFSLVYVNQRPVLFKKILKILNKQLAVCFGESFSPRKFAVCLISINCLPSVVDVNLEPNKSKVLLKDEDVLLISIEEQLVAYYSSMIKEKSSSSEELQLFQDAVPAQANEDCPRKKRKLDDDMALLENDLVENKSIASTFEMQSDFNGLNQIVHGQETCPSIADRNTDTNALQYFEQPAINSEDVIAHHPCSVSSSLCEDKSTDLPGAVFPPHHSTKTNHTQDDFSVGQNDFIHLTENDNSSRLNGLNCVKSVSDVDSEKTVSASDSSNKEFLWDHIDEDHLDKISECLDVLEGMPVQSVTTENRAAHPLESPLPNTINSKAWSMGQVPAPQGDLVRGSCVLVEGKTNGLHERDYEVKGAAQQNVTPEVQAISNLTRENSTVLELQSNRNLPFNESLSVRENNYEDKMKSDSLSPQKSPRAAGNSGVSPDFNSSLQSVSSQMGRRELAAFTKFARDVRPQIILENPGIAFTHVAALLAEKWRSLSSGERDRYEEIAREAATTKKVWKTLDKQKKLDWVKKLPVQSEKKRILPKIPSQQKIQRCQKPWSVNIDFVKEKCLKFARQSECYESSDVKLLGQLQPSGMWMCVEKSQISILSHSRLQEVVVNDRLLHTFSLSLKPLHPLVKLDKLNLGEENWSTLISLPCFFDKMRHTRVVSADVISKNGFKVEICQDNQSAVLMEVAETLNYYGVRELKETLTLYRTWPTGELSKCRPLRVISHIRSEAMRICRKSPSILDRTMVEELVDYWKTVMHFKEDSCLHSKPILTPVFNIVDRALCKNSKNEQSI